MRRGLALRAVLGVALVCAATAARADVQIEGDAASLRVIANNASLNDVLAALKTKLGLRYGAVNVEKQINGTVSGTLHRVVVQLLDGFDSVVSRSAEGVEIVQIAPRGMASATGGRRGVTHWQTPTPQAMAQPPQ